MAVLRGNRPGAAAGVVRAMTTRAITVKVAMTTPATMAKATVAMVMATTTATTTIKAGAVMDKVVTAKDTINVSTSCNQRCVSVLSRKNCTCTICSAPFLLS